MSDWTPCKCGHEHDAHSADLDGLCLKCDCEGYYGFKILSHPPEVIDVDPALIADMKRRLVEPKPEPEPESVFERD